jgi:hypothetical protein
MKTKHQHSENWLDGAIRHVELLCKDAAACPEEYEVPTEQTVQSAQQLLKEFQNCENPQIALTQDGEFVVTWTHFGDKFKAIVRDDGRVALFENKNKVDHDSFVRKLTQVPA